MFHRLRSWLGRLTVRSFRIWGVEIGVQPPPDPISPPPTRRKTVKPSELGDRGSAILWLGPPLVDDPRYVHFSWGSLAGPDSFKVRDYIAGRLYQHQGATRQAEQGFVLDEWPRSRDEIWEAAKGRKDRIPTGGDLYHKVEDFDWWRKKLTELTRKRKEESAAPDPAD